jgi:hypothetical protein
MMHDERQAPVTLWGNIWVGLFVLLTMAGLGVCAVLVMVLVALL